MHELRLFGLHALAKITCSNHDAFQAEDMIFPRLIDSNEAHRLKDIAISLIVHEQQVAVDLALNKLEDGLFVEQNLHCYNLAHFSLV